MGARVGGEQVASYKAIGGFGAGERCNLVNYHSVGSSSSGTERMLAEEMGGSGLVQPWTWGTLRPLLLVLTYLLTS